MRLKTNYRLFLLVAFVLATNAVLAGSDTRATLRKKIEAATGNQKIPFIISLTETYPAVSDTILILLKQAQKILNKFPDQNKQAAVNNQLGNYYSTFEKNKTAVQYYLKAATGFKNTNDYKGLARVYNNIGMVYFLQRNFDRALEYYNKSVDLKRVIKDTVSIISTLNNIAAIQYELNQYDSAIASFTQILDQYSSRLSKFNEANVLSNVGCCFLETHKYVNALVYFNLAQKIYEALDDTENLCLTYGNFAKTYNGMKDYPNAIVFGQKALLLAQQLKIKSLIEAACSGLRMAYAGIGDYRNAYLYTLQEMQTKDTIYDRETKEVIAELETKYKTSEKEKENALLVRKNQIHILEINRNRWLMGGLIILLVLGGLIAFLIVRQNRIRSRQRTLQAEQKLLRSQMNPHFIFNSLTAIESFVYSNQPKEAGKYMSDFARLMRLILENSREEEITLEKEIQTLEYYLGMQKLRMENKLEWAIRTDATLDISDTFIPPMLAQPFIENAIEHGIRPLNAPGRVEVIFKKQQDGLWLEITDNGVGYTQSVFNKQQRQEQTGMGMAITITRERLENINRTRKNKIVLTITDIGTENSGLTGTRVQFTIPFW